MRKLEGEITLRQIKKEQKHGTRKHRNISCQPKKAQLVLNTKFSGPYNQPLKEKNKRTDTDKERFGLDAGNEANN